MSEGLEQLIQRLKNASDLEAISEAVADHLRGMGFDHFAYLAVHPPSGPYEPIYLGSYPEAWTDHYISNDYVNVDPVMPAASTRLSPFTWNQLQASLPAKGPQRRVLDEAGEFGLKFGITVPVHGPAQALATLNVSANIPAGDYDAVWNNTRHILQLVAIYCHETILQRILAEAGRKLPQIAPRERECLLWTARGKTAWEVSTILGLSQETVIHYLKSAASKLGVHNKTHAVVKAILLGLIVP